MQIIWGMAGIAALMGGAGYLLDKTGEAVNDASTGAVKIAVAGATIYGGYLILKKGKVV